MIYDTLIIAGAILGIGGISYLTWYLLPRPGAHRGPKRPPAATPARCTCGADSDWLMATTSVRDCPEHGDEGRCDETAFLPAPAGPGEWLPRSPQIDDTVRYLADAGCLDPETEIEQARLREALSGVDSHVRTDASAPGWLGAGDFGSHRSPDWREQTAVDLDPVTLAGQAAVLPPALASVPLVDYDPWHAPGECEDGAACPVHGEPDLLIKFAGPLSEEEVEKFRRNLTVALRQPENVSRPGPIGQCGETSASGPGGPLSTPVDPDPGPDAAGLLALTAAPECSCVLGNEPLTATTPIAACPARHDDDADPPDPDEWAFQQARAYVLSVAEQAAYTADEAIAYAELTGLPQAADPAWAGCFGPWHLGLEESAELVSA